MFFQSFIFFNHSTLLSTQKKPLSNLKNLSAFSTGLQRYSAFSLHQIFLKDFFHHPLLPKPPKHSTSLRTPPSTLSLRERKDRYFIRDYPTNSQVLVIHNEKVSGAVNSLRPAKSAPGKRFAVPPKTETEQIT